jgi:hypothetical protein
MPVFGDEVDPDETEYENYDEEEGTEEWGANVEPHPDPNDEDYKGMIYVGRYDGENKRVGFDQDNAVKYILAHPLMNRTRRLKSPTCTTIGSVQMRTMICLRIEKLAKKSCWSDDMPRCTRKDRKPLGMLRHMNLTVAYFHQSG